MPNRALIYAFPFFLLLMEWLLRVSLTVNSQEFVAPTIAAAGLGLLIPLTGFKRREVKIPDDTKRQIDALGWVLVPKRERHLIDFVWLAVLVALGGWASCLVFACKPQANPMRVAPFWYAMAVYFLAVIFSELKEAA
jgi:hypothetical protein